MDIVDDELITEYIEESREHLANIESDLLVIEEQGASINLDLVNKVFRAAHSIKGGAGFLSLSMVKELSHKIENVLSLVRNRELVPTPEIINVLLISFDKLREMINNLEESDTVDISKLLISLADLVSPPSEVDSLAVTVSDKILFLLPNSTEYIEVSRFDIDQAHKEGNYIYLVSFDLIHDVQRLWRTPHDLIRVIYECGLLLESMISLMDVGTLDDDPVNCIPFYALIASTQNIPELAAKLKIEQKSIAQVAIPSEEAAAIQLKSPDKPVATAAASEIAANTLQLSSPEPLQPAKNIEIASQPAIKTPVETPVQTSATPAADSTLRINVSLLDTLMNLAGEMVLGRNQLLQAISRNDQIAIKAAGYRISTVTSELQESIMMTRMQPIGNVFNRFTRIVRDLSRDLGKDINLVITGKDVELDKTIIEGLGDPLTHLIRNAVDHGIELPEKRRAAGKNTTGTMHLNAYHEAGQVIIEIIDDGGGINPEKMTSVAVSKGIITTEQARVMTEKEKKFLIMMPGFSTADKITDVSGRGVGMDVVKSNIERLNGQIEIDSEFGRGTVFRIKLPLTLAIIPSLFVVAGNQRFAIPQANVVETIRINAAQVKERISQIGDADVLHLRGSIIPVVRLVNVLNIPNTMMVPDGVETTQDRRQRISDRRSLLSLLPDECEPAQPIENIQMMERNEDRRSRVESDLNLVIVTTGTILYGLVVQKLLDSEEIVVKPLGRHIKQIQAYAGATIMGDGRVALIIDANGLASTGGIDLLSTMAVNAELALAATADTMETQALLTFQYGSQQLAVPLELVTRVEKITGSDIEKIGDRRVMQYRGQIMPLVTVSDVSKPCELDSEGDQVVIVFEVADHEVGLIANTPVDSIECRDKIDSDTLRQKGIIGSVILQKKTFMIVDIFELVEALHPEWFVERRMVRGGTNKIGMTVLLAEDSDFFRSQIKKFMEDEGYRVIACEDGQTAWQVLNSQTEDIRLVVTDIEMPHMNGYELTKRIRGDTRFLELPVIAVTSLAGDEDIERGKQAGLDRYLVKLDREKLLDAIAAVSLI